MDDRLMNRTARFVTAFLTFSKARTSISRPAHARTRWRESLSLIGLSASQRASKIVARGHSRGRPGGIRTIFKAKKAHRLQDDVVERDSITPKTASQKAALNLICS
jgi:hypothetical protein